MSTSNDKPSFVVPPLACDAHFHIFGPLAKYPLVGEQRNPFPGDNEESYREYCKILGLQRGVIVQPSNYSGDNSCTLDAVAALGAENYRAIVDITPEITDAELERLHEQGVRGVRINTKPIQPLTKGLPELVAKRTAAIEPICKRMGWSIDYLFADWLTCEMIPYLEKVRVPFSIAHIGMNKGCHGTSTGGFRKLVDFLRLGEGYCWIKLTAPYRCSLDPNYADIVPLAQEVIAAAENRIIWGSDIPHMGFMDSNSIQLFNLMRDFAPDEKTRNRILVDNPAELYGF